MCVMGSALDGPQMGLSDMTWAAAKSADSASFNGQSAADLAQLMVALQASRREVASRPRSSRTLTRCWAPSSASPPRHLPPPPVPVRH